MCDETIKISIIVPICNVEDYMRPCIESIMGQSYENLEIILIDDGSTDRCPEICDDYAKKDKRIHVIHKCNGGVTSARRIGAAAATGDYVLGVDGDDWIEKDRVEVLVREGIQPTHADMIHLSGYILDYAEEENESKRRSPDVPIKLFENDEIENEIFPLILRQDIVGSLCMWAIRRELLLRNQMLIDDRVIYEEDSLCICLCLLEAKSVMTIQQSGYHYIQRSSSLVHQRRSTFHKNPLKIWYRILKNQLDQKHASEKIREICGRIAANFIMRYYCYDYDWLLKSFPGYLFPFPKIGSGSRIAVYGAGKFGYKFVQSLDKARDYSVVLWVDQKQDLPTVPGYNISSRDAILSADYDFIVVAILDAAVAEEVKRSLILDGIPEEKIATMEAGTIL